MFTTERVEIKVIKEKEYQLEYQQQRHQGMIDYLLTKIVFQDKIPVKDISTKNH